MRVVCDSTILIGLAKIGKLDLLMRIFTEIRIPEEVFREVAEKGEKKPGARLIKEAPWIVTDPITDRTQANLLTASLGKGEAEVLTLAKEIKADLILIDEEKARKSAIIAGFNVMGLLGLFIIAKNLGLLEEIKPLVDELRRENFRISDKIVAEALSKAGEKP